jgi:hypothetical protein
MQQTQNQQQSPKPLQQSPEPQQHGTSAHAGFIVSPGNIALSRSLSVLLSWADVESPSALSCVSKAIEIWDVSYGKPVSRLYEVCKIEHGTAFLPHWIG